MSQVVTLWLLLVGLVICSQIPIQQDDDVLQYVNPLIGTGGVGFGIGSNPPGPQAPFAAMRLSPDTVNWENFFIPFDHFGGYYHPDSVIRTFSFFTTTMKKGLLLAPTLQAMGHSEVDDEPEQISLSVRRATLNDETEIISLIGEEGFVLTKNYGDYDVESLIENSYLSVVAIDESDAIAGFAAFQTKPHASKEDFLEKSIQSGPHANVRKSVWLWFFKAEPLHKEEIRDEIFRTVFTTFAEVDYILYAPSQASKHPTIFPLSEFDRYSEYYFGVERQHYTSSIVIRQGKVEDNDDLLYLLEFKNLTTVKVEGEFYIADLLHKQDDKNKCGSEFVGLMYVSATTPDVNVLAHDFCLGDFDEFFQDLRNDGNFQSSAFEIRLFYLRPDFIDRSQCFLEFAFNSFKDIQYAIIHLPFHESAHPLMAQFMYVSPSEQSNCSEALHILPRVAFFADLSVELSKSNDIEQLVMVKDSELDEESKNALTALDDKTKIITLRDKNNDEGFLGVCVTTDDVSQYVLRRYFDVQGKGSCACILGFWVDARYANLSNIFTRELMKLLNINLLFYGIKGNSRPNHTLNKEMIWCKPKRQIEIEGRPRTPPYDSLYYISTKMKSEPKTEIHSRIVVIGASLTGLSFVKTLVTLSYLYFSNITIIYPGTPELCSSSSPFHHNPNPDYDESTIEALLQLPNVSRTCAARLVEIERREKRVIYEIEVDENVDSYAVPYDYLVLTSSRTYKLPQTLTSLQSYPEFGILDLGSADEEGIDRVRDACKELLGYRDELSKILVYGSNWDVFCTVYTLVKTLSVPSSKIMMCFPEGTQFEDPKLEARVDLILDNLGIRTYRHYTLANFGVEENGVLTKVYLNYTPPNKTDTDDTRRRKRLLEVPCALLINCHDKDVDERILSTIYKQSLVFDGRLIVEPSFRTTDEHIYAAGPLTKFSRRFGVSNSMESFNSTEIGFKLAHSVLKALGIVTKYNNTNEEKESIPVFTMNLKAQFRMPNGHYYFQCKTAHFDTNKCIQLVTDVGGDVDKIIPNMLQRYTSVYVNKETGQIESIMYLGTTPIANNNLSSLVGVPASYCNNMIGRYQEGLVKDFIEFFSENWAMCLFCDQFDAFREQLSTLLLNNDDILAIAGVIISSMQHGTLDRLDEAEVLVNLPDKVSRETRLFIEKYIIGFLVTNQNTLQLIPQVYYTPKTE